RWRRRHVDVGRFLKESDLGRPMLSPPTDVARESQVPRGRGEKVVVRRVREARRVERRQRLRVTESRLDQPEPGGVERLDATAHKITAPEATAKPAPAASQMPRTS